MNRLEQITAMAIFARIAENLSYTETAKVMGLSKSMVSKEISRLEASLGIVLIARTTRSMELTPVGRTYYEYCSRLLVEADGAEAFVRQYHEEPAGNLHVVAPITFGNHGILPILSRFIAQHPHVQVDFDLTDKLIDINTQHIDIAIVISKHRPDNGIAIALSQIEWGVYAAPAYLEKHPCILEPEDLIPHKFLLFRGSAHTPTISFNLKRKCIEVRLRPILRSNNSIALLNSAIAGLGIAHLPRYVVGDALKAGNLQRLLPDWELESHTAYILCRDERYLAPRVRAFVEDLTRHFAGDDSTKFSTLSSTFR